MTTLTVTEARSRWSEIMNAVAFKGERVMLRRNGKPIATIVSAEDADLLEFIGDHIDVEDARQRMADGQAPLSYEQARKQLGLD